jgi:hypothetical protein
MLYLYKGHSSPQYLEKAYELYFKYFTDQGTCYPFEEIS